MADSESVTEARREMEICNACRYCEGFCAVFPAMARERAFSDGDLTYLANLCHNCQGCYYACQYAPPHPFGVNVPQTFAQLRQESYRDFAWPRPLARAFDRNGATVALVTSVALAVVLILAASLVGPGVLGRAYHGPGAFYRIIPWTVMTSVATATLLYAVVALVIAGARFWRSSGRDQRVAPRAVVEGLRDALTLKNLSGGGHGCNDRDEAFSQGRRHFHHMMAYGFLACFASTTSAAFEAYFLGVPAPYPIFSVPVVLGTLGGLGLMIGTAGLVRLKMVANRAASAAELFGADLALLALLWLAGASGLLLLGFRGTSAMGTLLAIHLGFVLALFLLLPYSKFVHVVHRSLALIRNAADMTDR